MQSPFHRQMVFRPLANSLRGYRARMVRTASLEHYCERCGKGVVLSRASTSETVTCKCGWVWKGDGFQSRAERRAAR